MTNPGSRSTFASALALEAGQRSLEGFGCCSAQLKESADGLDLATVHDQMTERFVRDRIQRTYGEPVLGEEEGIDGDPRQAQAALWIVDPIDGTFNYQRGLPWYGVSIAFCRNRVPEVAAIYLPALDELYSAALGTGAFLTCGGETHSIHVDGTDAPHPLMLGLDGSNLVDLVARHQKLGLPRRGIRVLLCATYSLIAVASGKLHLFAHSGINLWDCAAGDLILREAGGTGCLDEHLQPIFPEQLNRFLAEPTSPKFPLIAAANLSTARIPGQTLLA